LKVVAEQILGLLIERIMELEQRVNAYKASVNTLCEKDGLPPMFPNGGGGGSKPASDSAPSPIRPDMPTAIRPGAFYGKKQQTAVRELLAMRKAAGGNGPAKPNEILEALKAGGYQVEAKTDEIALVGLRAMLRKRNTVFHKLPNGAWGLREWYPGAKPAKDAAKAKDAEAPTDPFDESSETEAADAAKTSAA
jgi:hypothetical protein